jgi:hypothetical protein
MEDRSKTDGGRDLWGREFQLLKLEANEGGGKSPIM